MENKIIVLCGKSGSGKDRILKEMIGRFDIFPIISDTTRPMRDGEVNGKDYHFISKDMFMKEKANGKYVENRVYNTKENGVDTTWYYGIHNTAVNLEAVNHIVIVDLEGLQSLKNVYGSIVSAIYIDVNDSIREERAKSRGSFKQDEWDRRLEDDAVKFSNYEVNDNVDYIISNDGELSDALEMVRDIIKDELKLL